jgi:methylmalonyl-CoA/ethylmalonyl-CoA epimerase
MMRLHHIGVACRDIEEEIARLSGVHAVVARTPVVADTQQDAQLAMLTLEDGTRIELVAGKQVEAWVKRKVGLYHLCFEVEDIGAEIRRLEKEGATLVSPPKPAVLFEGRVVAFLYVAYGLIELLSNK